MLIRIVLSGTAIMGGVFFAATADEPVPPKPVQKAKTEIRTKDKASAQVLKAPAGPEEADAEPEKIEPSEEATALIPQKPSPDEPAIKLIDEAFISAYEAGDAKGVASHFTEDAEFVDATGTIYEGREAIEACLTTFFVANPGCKLEIVADSVRTISPGVVVQDGSTLVSRTEDSTPVECRYTSVYVKTNDQWMIASVRDSVPHGRREHSVQLQQLTWLIGDWIDEGDDSIVNFSCESVDSGNFLLRKFTVVAGGQEAMSGTQRIGWDPLTGKLRTWIFDSEGGYGEGLWHHDPENDRWVLKTTGVTADGQTASSTSLYTFVNDHTMTWQSVDYEIAGIQQPDSDVVTIVRHSPGPAPVVAADQEQ